MLSIINPATGLQIDQIECDDSTSLTEKLSRSRIAQKKWQTTPIDHRLSVVQKWSHLLTVSQEKLAQTLTNEMGKPIAQSRSEISAVASRIHFFIKHAPALLEPTELGENSGTQEEITYEPLGVIGNISAWNYPYFIGVNVFVPALITGNTVLYKPSEFASLTGLSIANLFYEAGLPWDVFLPVIGTGEIGSFLVAQELDGLFFTGSYATGKKIASTAREKMIRMQFELGGKDPTYVCDDANIESAARSLVEGVFYNNGQSCCSVERIYVHRSVYDSFVDRFIEQASALKIGDPLSEDTFLGPLARQAQLDVLDSQVKNARQHGGRILLGGHRLDRPGYYFAPTVVGNANHDMLLMREESFGPIIGIQAVHDDDEAMARMADTDYGLTAGVYSRSQSRARHILSAMNTGTVYWNCCDRVSPRLPWSGRSHSGLGSTLGLEGIRSFLQPKSWHLRS